MIFQRGSILQIQGCPKYSKNAVRAQYSCLACMPRDPAEDKCNREFVVLTFLKDILSIHC